MILINYSKGKQFEENVIFTGNPKSHNWLDEILIIVKRLMSFPSTVKDHGSLRYEILASLLNWMDLCETGRDRGTGSRPPREGGSVKLNAPIWRYLFLSVSPSVIILFNSIRLIFDLQHVNQCDLDRKSIYDLWIDTRLGFMTCIYTYFQIMWQISNLFQNTLSNIPLGPNGPRFKCMEYWNNFIFLCILVFSNTCQHFTSVFPNTSQYSTTCLFKEFVCNLYVTNLLHTCYDFVLDKWLKCHYFSREYILKS